MAWAMSVRSRRERASSAVRRLITRGIDTSAQRSNSRIVLHIAGVCLQLAVLIAAFAHITVAPLLALLAIAGVLTGLASSCWPERHDPVLGGHGSPAKDNTPVFEAGNIGAPSSQHAFEMPALPLGMGLHAVTASGFPNTIYKPVSRIAPANDAHAWAGLCARLSHELRTPLNAVLGFSELMKCELHGPLGRPRYREYVTHIRESGRALLKSTEDTLALTELLSGSHQGTPATLRALAIEPLLEDVWRLLEPLAQDRSIRLVLNVPPDLEVLGDQRALRQSLINLLEEAISHAAEGGIVRVAAVPARSFVDLDIDAGGRNAERLADTLSIHLARALLEISGAKLAISTDNGKWHARTLLDRATQADFFENSGRKAAAG